MEVTTEILKEELKGLVEQREKTIAQLNQIAGAIAMTEQLITKIETPEPKKELKKNENK